MTNRQSNSRAASAAGSRPKQPRTRLAPTPQKGFQLVGSRAGREIQTERISVSRQ